MFSSRIFGNKIQTNCPPFFSIYIPEMLIASIHSLTQSECSFMHALDGVRVGEFKSASILAYSYFFLILITCLLKEVRLF